MRRMRLAGLPDSPSPPPVPTGSRPTPGPRPPRRPRSLSAGRVPHVRSCGRHREALSASPGSQQRRGAGSGFSPAALRVSAATASCRPSHWTTALVTAPFTTPSGRSDDDGARRWVCPLGRQRPETSLTRRRGRVSRRHRPRSRRTSDRCALPCRVGRPCPFSSSPDARSGPDPQSTCLQLSTR